MIINLKTTDIIQCFLCMEALVNCYNASLCDLRKAIVMFTICSIHGNCIDSLVSLGCFLSYSEAGENDAQNGC